MLNSRARLQWRQFGEWILANAIGWAVGFGLAEALLPAYTASLALVVTAAYALGAAGLGCAQWLSLRRLGPVSSAWAAVTTLGFLTGYLAFRLLGDAWGGESQAGFMLIGLFSLVGAGVGIGQWLLLRRQFRHAGWWVLVVVVGWLGGAGMWGVLTGLKAGVLVSNLGAGLVAGIVTGYGWSWLSSGAFNSAAGLEIRR